MRWKRQKENKKEFLLEFCPWISENIYFLGILVCNVKFFFVWNIILMVQVYLKGGREKKIISLKSRFSFHLSTSFLSFILFFFLVFFVRLKKTPLSFNHEHKSRACERIFFFPFVGSSIKLSPSFYYYLFFFFCNIYTDVFCFHFIMLFSQPRASILSCFILFSMSYVYLSTAQTYEWAK